MGAEYGDKVNDFNRPYDIWQHTSKGRIDGNNGYAGILGREIDAIQIEVR